MSVSDHPKLLETRPAPITYTPFVETSYYRRILGHFATGVTVITSIDHGQPIGFTVTSFSSVSLEPALISFCAGNSLTTWPRIEEAGIFCVNILSDKQKEVYGVFSREGGAHFQATEYHQSASGVPILANVLVWIECSVVAIYSAGDHVIVLGRVHDMEAVKEGKPLILYKGTLGTFEPR